MITIHGGLLTIMTTFIALLSLLAVRSATAFVSSGRSYTSSTTRYVVSSQPNYRLDSSLFASSSDNTICDAKLKIEEAIVNTDRGRSISTDQRAEVHNLLSNLEALCPIPEPARDKRMEGPWIVLYTDAPPPSNGQLGFLKGIAKQVISLKDGSYRNELYIGGSGQDQDEDAWLSAILDATWTEWDGIYLDSTDDNIPAVESSPGSTTWKVDFESITLNVFQKPLFTQQFKAGTSRTWKMSYLDDDTRIVRAGKTGRGEDDWVFYMKRGGSP